MPGSIDGLEFERLMSATLWALDEAMAGGCQVHLVTLTGKSLWVQPTAGGRAEACLMLAELQPSPVGSARPPAVPAGAVLLTTRTGAERLAGGSGPVARGPSGDGAGPAFGRARLVVV